MIVTEAMRIQLALQSACLQDMGYRVSGTEIFFTTHHRRIPVDLEPDDYRKAEQAVREVLELVDSDVAPDPLEDDARCMCCSHVGICLPEERRLKPVARRNIMVSADCQVTHLATPGAKAFSRGGRMVVYRGGAKNSHPSPWTPFRVFKFMGTPIYRAA